MTEAKTFPASEQQKLPAGTKVKFTVDGKSYNGEVIATRRKWFTVEVIDDRKPSGKRDWTATDTLGSVHAIRPGETYEIFND